MTKSVDELLAALREEAAADAVKTLVSEWQDGGGVWQQLASVCGERRAAEITICLLGEALTAGAIESFDYDCGEGDERAKLRTDVEGMYDELSIFVGKDVCLSRK